MLGAVASRSSHGSGTSAKLPVTSSSPSSTIMTKPTGKDQRADQRLAGLHRAGDGEAGGGGQNAPGERAADEQIGRRQIELAAPGFDHGAGDVDSASHNPSVSPFIFFAGASSPGSQVQRCAGAASGRPAMK